MNTELDKQRKETFWVFNDIASKNPIPEMAIVEFQMIPINTGADWGAFEKEIHSQGFGTKRFEDEDDQYMEVSTRPLVLSAEAIWGHEERLTETARQYDFKPDGWGFYGVPADQNFIGM